MVERQLPPQPAVVVDPKAAAPSAEIPGVVEQSKKDQQRVLLIILVVAVLLVALAIGGVLLLMNQSLDEVARVRDIFIIFMAVQSMLTGLALVILLVQLARLINLLQNEIKPILETTRDTANTMRGTTLFLGENLVEPVLKFNEYLAGLSQLLSMIGLAKRSSRRQDTKGE